MSSTTAVVDTCRAYLDSIDRQLQGLMQELLSDYVIGCRDLYGLLSALAVMAVIALD